MNKLNGQSKDVLEDNVSKIKELFPEAFEEGKIDFDVLKKLLGNFVDNGTERYSFSWNGKGDAIKTALTPTSSTLRPDRESSKNWDNTQNIFVEGDNLDVLKVIQDTYRNKIKIIYIDPPYNTGNDFVYNDFFDDAVDDYKERTNQAMVSNANTSGRYHTNWLNMMYPRLRLARNLLKEDGVIFISIGEEEVDNLIKISSEIFGENNRLGVITRVAKTASNKGTHFAPTTDYLVVFCKDIACVSPFKGEVDESLYKKTEEAGDRKGEKYRDDVALYQSGLIGDRPNCRYFIEAPDGSKVIPPVGKFWRWFPDTCKKNEKLLIFKETSSSPLFDENGNKAKYNIYTKSYLTDRQETGTLPRNLWTDFINRKGTDLLKRLDIPFDFSKPVELVKYILEISNDTSSLVLDFFAGSGTTAHAVMELNMEDGGNRKFITVQLPEETDKDSEAYKAGYKYISDISKERIRRAGEKIKADNKDKEGIDKLDIGFKAFTLDSTNLTLWDEKTQDLQTSLLEQINSTKNGRTQEDVLYEVLLKYGVDLATPITEESINGKKVYSIAGGYLLVCLDKDIDLETVSEIAKKKPERVVFYDHGFKDDMVKINAEQTLKKAGIEDIRVI